LGCDIIGYPLKNLIQEKPSHGGLDEKLGTTTFATQSDILMAEHHPSNDLIKEVKFISPFISHPCKAKCPSSPSPKFEPCPSGQHVITLEKENFWAMDKLETPTL
jgi:hypothetical protein